jgi:hypothetical protein
MSLCLTVPAGQDAKTQEPIVAAFEQRHARFVKSEQDAKRHGRMHGGIGGISHETKAAATASTTKTDLCMIGLSVVSEKIWGYLCVLTQSTNRPSHVSERLPFLSLCGCGPVDASLAIHEAALSGV